MKVSAGSSESGGELDTRPPRLRMGRDDDDYEVPRPCRKTHLAKPPRATSSPISYEPAAHVSSRRSSSVSVDIARGAKPRASSTRKEDEGL